MVIRKALGQPMGAILVVAEKIFQEDSERQRLNFHLLFLAACPAYEPDCSGIHHLEKMNASAVLARFVIKYFNFVHHESSAYVFTG
jgi:hypothetical protein